MGRVLSEEMIEKAKSSDLCDVAKALGFTVIRAGTCHSLKEMDSIRIFNRRSWYRFSDGTGGSQIDFLRVFFGMDFVEAVKYLQDFSFSSLTAEAEHSSYVERNKAEFVLPQPSSDNLRAIRYLTNERMLSEKTVEKFIGEGCVYEEKKYHNIVFVGADITGTPKCAFMRGIYEKNGKSFKCDVPGSDKNYGFHMEVPESDTVRVYESAIDLMSFYDATSLSSDHLLALGMTADKPLERYLSDRKAIRKIVLCLDNDDPGRKAAEKISRKYLENGYEVHNLGSPKGYKDYNEWLVASKGRIQQRPKQVLSSKTR